MINLVLDFDGIINNEPFATMGAFEKVFKSIKAKQTPEEAYLLLKHLDEVQGWLDYDEIISNAFREMGVKKPERCARLFKECYKIAPNWELIKMLDQYKDVLNVIIFSRNGGSANKKFLAEHNISRYFSKIYTRQKKHLLKTFDELCKAENLKKDNTLFVGDEIYDVYIPKIMGYNFILFEPLFSKLPLDKAILEKLYEDYYDEIANLW